MVGRHRPGNRDSIHNDLPVLGIERGMKRMIGKKVIVRSTHAGVFFGTLKAKVGQEVTLTACRRIWYWDGAASISQLAAEGTKKPDSCKFTMPVDEIVIMEAIEIIPCTPQAIKSIEGVPEWKI